MSEGSETLAREWLDKYGVDLSAYSCVFESQKWVEIDEDLEQGLAALLDRVREEGQREGYDAESLDALCEQAKLEERERIKGIVEEYAHAMFCDEILRRIEEGK